MKYLNTKKIKKVSVMVITLIFFSTVLIYAFASGIDGRTLKTTTTGCSCHNATASTSVIVFISGPDTVTVNQTANYTIEISEPSKNGAGVDIASKLGSLGVVTSGLHLSNGELINSTNIAMTNHAVILTFSYTAPANSSTDTIWATGLATNSNGQSNGDIWNWAQSKRINVKNSVGITPISSTVPSEYKLSQNFPNPFNPTTRIAFSIPKSSLTKIDIIDITGRVVENLVNESLNAGEYVVNWNANYFSSGVYFCRITANGYSETKKMSLIK